MKNIEYSYCLNPIFNNKRLFLNVTHSKLFNVSDFIKTEKEIKEKCDKDFDKFIEIAKNEYGFIVDMDFPPKILNTRYAE